MIVCICNNVNSATIKSSIDEGATSVEDVRKATTATDCCGKCQFKVNSLIQSHAKPDCYSSPAFVAQN